MLQYLILLVIAIIVTAAEDWEDTPETTLVWQLISSGQNNHLHQFFIDNPAAMTMRSSDGRGALWWAWEYKNAEALAVLAVHGNDLHFTSTDRDGNTPKDLCNDYESVLNQAQQYIPEKKQERAFIEEQIRIEREKMHSLEDDDGEEEEDDDEIDEEDDEYEASDFDDNANEEFFHEEI